MHHLANHSLTAHGHKPFRLQGKGSRLLSGRRRHLRFDESSYLKLISTIIQIEKSAIKTYEALRGEKGDRFQSLRYYHVGALKEVKSIQDKYPSSLLEKSYNWDTEVSSVLARISDVWSANWIQLRVALSIERNLLEKYNLALTNAPKEDRSVFTYLVLSTRKNIQKLERITGSKT